MAVLLAIDCNPEAHSIFSVSFCLRGITQNSCEQAIHIKWFLVFIRLLIYLIDGRDYMPIKF